MSQYCGSFLHKGLSTHFCAFAQGTFKNLGNREIIRLDITMQSLIQDIFSQIIDCCLHFPEKFCDFSCNELNFKKVIAHVNSFWSDVYKK